MNPSKRMDRVAEYPFARWGVHCGAAAARRGDVIRLDIGNPDLPPPEAVIEAACRALRSPSTHGYPGYRGAAELRLAICAYYERRFSVHLDPDAEVACLLGSKEGIVHLPWAVLDDGNAVLVPDPGYAAYADAAGLCEAEIFRFPLAREHGYVPVLEEIPEAVVSRAKILWLNYPNNPTGAVAEIETFEKAVALARKYDLLLCHDAPYSDVRIGTVRPLSLLQVPGAIDVSIEFNSLSKTYHMAGWRIGYAVGNPEVLALLRRIKTNVDSGMFLPLQHAAVAALNLDESWIEARNAVYRDRLTLLADALRSCGLGAEIPQATPYLWTELPAGTASEPLALRLLHETGVAVAPGTFFGPRGEGFVRVSAMAPTERIREACERLTQWNRFSERECSTLAVPESADSSE